MIGPAEGPASVQGQHVELMSVRDLKVTRRTRVGAGLQNLGNTCYLNSVLQCLAYLPPLSDAAARTLLHGLASAGQCPLNRMGKKCLACMLSQQITNQLSTFDRAVRPVDIISSMSLICPTFGRGRQEDAHEFLLGLLDAVERDTKRCIVALGGLKSQVTLIEELFCGRVQSQVRCEECGHCSNTYEAMTTLSLDVFRFSSLEASLSAFTAHEILDGANKYKCDKCARLVKARKWVSIYDEPNLLVIHLKRFDGITLGGKISRHVEFPTRLDITKHLSRRPPPHAQPGSQPHYNLTGIVVHQGGSLHSGHYVGYIRDGEGQWYCANDASVTRVSPQIVLQQQAYLLFYSRSELKHLAAPPVATPSTGPARGQAIARAAVSYTASFTQSTNTIGPALPPGHYANGHHANGHHAVGAAATPAAAAAPRANGTLYGPSLPPPVHGPPTAAASGARVSSVGAAGTSNTVKLPAKVPPPPGPPPVKIVAKGSTPAATVKIATVPALKPGIVVKGPAAPPAALPPQQQAGHDGKGAAAANGGSVAGSHKRGREEGGEEQDRGQQKGKQPRQENVSENPAGSDQQPRGRSGGQEGTEAARAKSNYHQQLGAASQEGHHQPTQQHPSLHSNTSASSVSKVPSASAAAAPTAMATRHTSAEDAAGAGGSKVPRTPWEKEVVKIERKLETEFRSVEPLMAAVREFMEQLKASGEPFTTLEDALANGLSEQRKAVLRQRIKQWQPAPAVKAAYDYMTSMMRGGVLPPDA